MAIQKIVSFNLGSEEYGLNVEDVLSIERIMPITRVPNVPAFIKGVINLRGNVIPVIDLLCKLDLGQLQYTEQTRVIISKYENIELGLIVEKTNDVIDISTENIEVAPSNNDQVDYFEGIAKLDGRLIILLKMEELIKTFYSESELTN